MAHEEAKDNSQLDTQMVEIEKAESNSIPQDVPTDDDDQVETTTAKAWLCIGVSSTKKQYSKVVAVGLTCSCAVPDSVLRQGRGQ